MPFHTWLPDAGAEAPTGGAVLLVGVLDKVGTFGFLRYCIPLFPDASQVRSRRLVLALCVIGILYGALLAIGQRDMKRLVAYTSVPHFGFIALGIFAFTTQGGTGAMLYMVNHGFSTGALFLVVGFLIARRGRRHDRRLRRRGQGRRRASAASSSSPACRRWRCPACRRSSASSSCWSGTFTRYRALAIVATFGIVLAAIYVLSCTSAR